MTRNWYENPGADGSFWVTPFQTTAQWITSGSDITTLRNGSYGSPRGNINVKGNYAPPWVIGRAGDPLVQVTDGKKSINVRIPLGTIPETPTSSVDQSIGGADTTQPYLVWAISGSTMNTASVQASGTVITGTYGMAIEDGSGPIMMDAYTFTNGISQGDNAIGNIQDYELTQANASATYVIQHMLAIALDPSQIGTTGPVWPLQIIDGGAVDTGPLPQGQTYGIPASTARPTGQTRGFYLLFDNAQQYGWFFYNVAAAGCLTLSAYSNLSANAALVTDLQNSISAVMGYLCILSNQTSLATMKGKAAGGVNAFPAPPLLDYSPTGGAPVSPSSFGAWYPSGYNTIWPAPAQAASLTITTPTQQNANGSFAATGSIVGYATAPTLNYRDGPNTANPTFNDVFTSLPLHRAWQAGDNWQLIAPDSTDGRGGPHWNEEGHQYWVNPYNPNTPISGLYQIGPNGGLQLGLMATPSAYAAWINGDAAATMPFVGALLNSSQTSYQRYGYWETVLAVPKINGFSFQICIENVQVAGTWPPEIDLRIYTDGAGVQTVLFEVATTASGWQQWTTSSSNGFDATVVHTYGWSWQTDFITFYIDDNQVYQIPTPQNDNYTTNPMFIYLLTGANYIGTVDPDPALLPAYVTIYRVSVYASKPPPGAFLALPAGASVTATSYTFTNPGLAAGTHTVSVRDANNTAVVVQSGTFAVVPGATPIITPTAPSLPAANKAFTQSGTLANYAAAPTLTEADDGASSIALPSGSTVSTTAFSFLHPGLPAGTHTTKISDGTNSGLVTYTVTAIPGGASPNPTIVTGTTASFVDAAGNRWSITAGQQIAVNGVVDTTTANVIELAWVNGVIWQENASNTWYSKATAGAAWSAGTPTSPLVGLPTITINAISPSPPPNSSFQVGGSLLNYSTAPTLTEADDGASSIALPSGSTVSTTAFSFLHPGLPSGSHTLSVSDGTYSNMVSYTVSTVGWTSLASTTNLSNTVTSLAAATAYDIQVYATNAVGQGPASTILTLTTIATLPSAPTGLTAAAPSTTSVALSWTAPASGTPPYTYTILQSPHGANTFTSAGTSTTTAFTVTGLTASTAYDFEITAANSAGTGPASTLLLVTTTAVSAIIPGSVTGLAAGVASASGVTLTWTAPATGTTPFTYHVMQSAHGANTFVSIGTPTATTFAVTGLSASTTYDFEVFASNATGNGSASAIVAVTTAAATAVLPGAPSAVSAGNPASTAVTISWAAPTTGTAPTKYTVQYKISTTGTWSTFAPPVGVTQTLAAGAIGSITDVASNVWTIVGGQVAVGGVIDGTTANVVQLAYVANLMWQKNNSNLWWSKTSPAASWVGGTATGPVMAVILLAGAGGSITDASANVWTIVGGQVAVGGVVDTTTSNVIELAYVGGLMWQENSSNLWWSKTSPTATWTGGTSTGPVIPGLSQAITGLTSATAYNFQVFATNAAGNGPASSPAISATTSAASTGAFSISNGNIIAPDGSVFTAVGVNVDNGNLQSIGDNVPTLFPKLNFIRMPDGARHPSSYYSAFISRMTALKIVVELEDHPWPIPNPYTGQALTDEVNWYSELASAFKGNPYVWFGTMNEPQSNTDMVAQQTAIYNGIRATGNNTIVMINHMGGGNPGQIGPPNGAPLNSYTSWTAVCHDLHFYGWEIPNNSSDPATVNSVLLGAASTSTGVLGCQVLRSADGLMPVIIGEYGNALDSVNLSVNGDAILTSVNTSGYGNGRAAWIFGVGGTNPADNLGSGGTLTSYGVVIRDYM